MNRHDRQAWQEKTARLNEGVELKLGMRVRSTDGDEGIVVKIVEGDEDFHGAVYVWQCDRLEYGADNCEHYCHSNWKDFLRIIE
jgi:hypothetical protein